VAATRRPSTPGDGKLIETRFLPNAAISSERLHDALHELPLAVTAKIR
jgi:hypothetical protein